MKGKGTWRRDSVATCQSSSKWQIGLSKSGQCNLDVARKLYPNYMPKWVSVAFFHQPAFILNVNVTLMKVQELIFVA